MIDLVFATTTMLADWGTWIAWRLLAWLAVGFAVAIPLCRHLARISDQYPPAEDEETR